MAAKKQSKKQQDKQGKSEVVAAAGTVIETAPAPTKAEKKNKNKKANQTAQNQEEPKPKNEVVDIFASSITTQPTITIPIVAPKKSGEKDSKTSNDKPSKKRKREEQKEEKEEESADSDSDEDDDGAEPEEGNLDSGDESGDENEEDSESDSADKEERDRRTIFVGNVALSLKRKDLQAEFKKYGTIKSIRLRSVPFAKLGLPRKVQFITKDFHDKRDSCNAYIEFATPEEAEAAVQHNGKLLGDKHIRVDTVIPNEQRQQQASQKSVFVGNLSYDVEDEELYKYFQGCGEIDYVRVIRDPETNFGKGFAYVAFKQEAGAKAAGEMNKTQFKNRELRVFRCKPAHLLAKQKMIKEAKLARTQGYQQRVENKQKKAILKDKKQPQKGVRLNVAPVSVEKKPVATTANSNNNNNKHGDFHSKHQQRSRSWEGSHSQQGKVLRTLRKGAAPAGSGGKSAPGGKKAKKPRHADGRNGKNGVRPAKKQRKE